MTQFLNILKDRRSIRKYKTDPVSEEHLNQLIEAVQCSQSWANTQCWELIVVKDPEIKKKLRQTVPEQNPGSPAVEKAPIVFALCGKAKTSGYINGEPHLKSGDWMMYDLGIATQNLCNTAHALGMGTVVVGWFDHDMAKKQLKVPPGYEVISLIPAGYPDQKGKSPQRREIESFVHEDIF
ncbi:MAG: nitroreductase [Desulfobacteraceae bacterium]|nr:nitroreductase [Desulfobacteraceae bacterium]